MTFAKCARRLVAAAQMLGWGPEDFWRATPADLANAVGLGAEDALDGAAVARLRDMIEEEGR